MHATKSLLLAGALLGFLVLGVSIQWRANVETERRASGSKVIVPTDPSPDTSQTGDAREQATVAGTVANSNEIDPRSSASSSAAAPETDAVRRLVATETVELTPEDLGEIVIAAIARNPVLASNPVLRHSHAERESATGVVHAMVIFEPFERSGVLAESADVPCHRATEDAPWQCLHFSRRQYLTVPEQSSEVPVLGVLSSDVAVASVEFARAFLANQGIRPMRLSAILAHRFNQDPSELLTMAFDTPEGSNSALVSVRPRITETGAIHFEDARIE